MSILSFFFHICILFILTEKLEIEWHALPVVIFNYNGINLERIWWLVWDNYEFFWALSIFTEDSWATMSSNELHLFINGWHCFVESISIWWKCYLIPHSCILLHFHWKLFLKYTQSEVILRFHNIIITIKWKITIYTQKKNKGNTNSSDIYLQ